MVGYSFFTAVGYALIRFFSFIQADDSNKKHPNLREVGLPMTWTFSYPLWVGYLRWIHF